MATRQIIIEVNDDTKSVTTKHAGDFSNEETLMYLERARHYYDCLVRTIASIGIMQNLQEEARIRGMIDPNGRR